MPIAPTESDDFDDNQDPIDDLEEEGSEEMEPEAPPPPPPVRRGPGKGRAGIRRKHQDPHAESLGAVERENPSLHGQPKGDVFIPRTKWRHRAIELLWPEMLAELRVQHHSAMEVEIRVKRIYPTEMTFPAAFNGGTVAVDSQDMSPATQMIDKITEDYHLASGVKSEAIYIIDVIWIARGSNWGRGELKLPPPQEIVNMRMAADNQARLRGDYPAVGISSYGGRQRPSYPQYQPSYPPPPYGYGQTPGYPPQLGYAPPPQVPGDDPEKAHLRQQLHFMQGQQTELMNAAREGRQPNLQQPPAQPPMTVDQVAAAVIEKLRPYLQPQPQVAPAPAAGVGAAPPGATPSVTAHSSKIVGGMEAMVSSMMGKVLESVVKNVSKNIETSLNGVGVETPEPLIPDPIVEEPEKPEDLLPFTLQPTGATWGNGSPVNYPINKETGSIDIMGALAGNPIIAEKISEGLSGLMGGIGDLARNVARSAIGQAKAAPEAPSQPPAHRMGVQGPPSQPVKPKNEDSGGGWPSV